MQQAENPQRPCQRQQQINQRRRVKRHRVPLSEKRHAAVVVGIPERQFTTSETFLLKVGEGIGEEAVVAHNERLQSEQDLRERGEDQQGKQDSKTQRREPV